MSRFGETWGQNQTSFFPLHHSQAEADVRQKSEMRDKNKTKQKPELFLHCVIDAWIQQVVQDGEEEPAPCCDA